MPLEFEPVLHRVVHQFSGVQRKISIADDHVRQPAVHVDDLGNLSGFEQLREVINLCAHGIIFIGQIMRLRVQYFALLSNIIADAFVLLRKLAELVAKFGSSASLFNLNFSSQRLELIDVFRATRLFNGQQLNVELLLICFLQK